MLSERPGKNRRLSVIWRDKWLLVSSLIILWFVRLSLSLIGYNRMIRRVSFQPNQPVPTSALALRVATSIRTASALVPNPTCLVQALAAKILLGLRGYGSQIKVGVRLNGNSFGAHAWLISDGKIVLGGDSENVASFQPLMKIE
ncbi:lasso peptide biosynthesis B2 protein [Sphingopyxis sp. JAI128]|uniref:lasso peptide biosynthesis B2 protein n=1 Tax=Sphingopyxis sp. JAI128 TaxID=2723066 RepID=UPI00161829F4|nr:lasso peptide biosynthesis B2 protein [Sphingopyxis sp. JAI128]